MRWATPRGFAPRTTPSGRRTPSRRCAGRVADALPGLRPAGARASARTGAGPAREPAPALGDGVGALAGAGELSPAAKERRDERVRQVAMTEARARIAAIDAGHRAAVEILSRLGFFPDESPSLGAKPASRTAAVTGDIDYGDDDDLEESARENHVEPKDDRPSRPRVPWF